MSNGDEYDIIICGGGTAGCALASRLKQGNPRLSVAIVERGEDRASDPLVLDPLAVSQLEDIGLDLVCSTLPQKELNSRVIELHAGNVLSGSSAINYGLWMRGDQSDYDHWASVTSSERWSYRGLLPYFKRSEKHHNHNADESQHGFDGPIKTSAGREYPLRKALHEGLCALGLQHNPDQHGGKPLGIGAYTENWSPTRQPASLAYNQAGVVHITGATVERLVLESDADGKLSATGVAFSRNSERCQIRARKEVIVSCGAHRTPQILMLSGIGPRDHLERLDIDVLVNNPDVGNNLFDHLGCQLPYKLVPEAAQAGVALGHPAFMSNARYLEGLAADWMALDSLPAAHLKTALKLDNPESKAINDTHPLLQNRVHHWIMAAYMPLSMGEGYDIGIDGRYISVGILNLLPTSRGTVRLSSVDPSKPPILDPQYMTTEHDRYVMRAALRKSLRLVETSALKQYIEGEAPPRGSLPLTSSASEEAIDARVRGVSKSIHHGAGTAAIGRVVDQDLKVKGVGGLRVCDASVFPAPVAATPQATVYAIAEALADVLLSENAGKQQHS